MTLISFCIPCHGRAHDLKQTMPHLIAAANASPPVEIAILDYNSPDDLFRWFFDFCHTAELDPGCQLSYHVYTGRDHWHTAHAFNLAMLAGKGDYLCLLGADAIPDPRYVGALRKLIADGCVWMHARDVCGILCVERGEFLASGGYDERIEFYGGEDRDFDSRLKRRGGKFGLVPMGLMHVIPTPNEEKTKHYRLKIQRRSMAQMGRAIWQENVAAGVLVANQGQEWGQWS